MMNISHKFKIDNTVYLLILTSLLSGYIKHVLLIMCIIIVHELGHVFFASIFHIEIESITIYPFGGLTILNKHIHERIYKDLLISIGGITFQLILKMIFDHCYKYHLIVTSTYNLFTTYNLHIIIFNLLPLIPLDGSKLIFTLLTKYIPFKLSYILSIIISSITLIIFTIYNTIYKINDIIIYIFLIYYLIKNIKDYKYIMNKFYLERLIYNHYYNNIIYNIKNINKLRIDKYYYFKENNKYIKEQDYLKKTYFNY